MDNITSSLQALSTGNAAGNANRSGLASELTNVPAAVNPVTTPQPSLDTLPVELQCLIMSKISDLRSLSALVHASPDLHRVYVEHRMSILRDIATQSLKRLEIDALGAYRSGTEVFQQTRNISTLWTFVEEQQARYSAGPLPSGSKWIVELSLDDIICIVRFHFSVIEPLTELFAHWALAELPSKPENRAACKSASLSDTETRRIQRAFYRMQIFCNICGSRGYGRSAPGRIDEKLDRVRVLSMFPAWEAEEIFSVHEFAKDKYTSVFPQIAWDLNEERNPKYRHLDMTEVNDSKMLIRQAPDGTECKGPSIETCL